MFLEIYYCAHVACASVGEVCDSSLPLVFQVL